MTAIETLPKPVGPKTRRRSCSGTLDLKPVRRVPAGTFTAQPAPQGGRPVNMRG